MFSLYATIFNGTEQVLGMFYQYLYRFDTENGTLLQKLPILNF